MTVIEILETLGIEYREGGTDKHVTANWIGLRCPWCGDDGWHLGIPRDGRVTSCWRCGVKPLGETLRLLSGVPWGRIRELTGGLDRGAPAPERPRGHLVIPEGVGPLQRPHRVWLQDARGLDPDELVRLWGVGGIGPHARLAWRVFVPVTQRGRTVSWTTRSIGNGTGSRYVGARPQEEAVRAKDLLFGADLARHAAIICEGPFDVFRVGPGAVATLGVGWSKAQLLAMSRYPVRAVCFDAEPAAQERARRLCEALAPFAGRTTRVELDAPDPGSASRSEIAKLRRSFLE